MDQCVCKDSPGFLRIAVVGEILQFVVTALQLRLVNRLRLAMLRDLLGLRRTADAR